LKWIEGRTTSEGDPRNPEGLRPRRRNFDWLKDSGRRRVTSTGERPTEGFTPKEVDRRIQGARREEARRVLADDA
jgi:hypothetical protein